MQKPNVIRVPEVIVDDSFITLNNINVPLDEIEWFSKVLKPFQHTILAVIKHVDYNEYIIEMQKQNIQPFMTHMHYRVNQPKSIAEHVNADRDIGVLELLQRITNTFLMIFGIKKMGPA